MNLPIRNQTVECGAPFGDVSSCERCHPSARQHNQLVGRCHWPQDGRILEVRSQFLSTGAVPEGAPSPLIRSWQRSSQFGFASQTLSRQRDRLAEAGLRRLKDCHGELIAAAWEEMASLGQELGEFGGVVVLTDPSGIVLNKLGGGSFSNEADKLGLSEGFDWSEQAIGTNAIGTAVLEQLALSVIGPEHLFCLNTSISCSAVPIVDPLGRLVGVLDVSTSFSVAHNHLLPLIKRAVSEIERRLFERRFSGQAKLRFHSDQYMLGSLREGLFAFDDDRLVGANRAALELVGLDWSSVGCTRFLQLFTTGLDVVERMAASGECKIRSRGGEAFFACLQVSRKPTSGTAFPVVSGRDALEASRNGSQPMHPHLALEQIQDQGTLRFRRMKAGQLIYGTDLIDDCGEAVLIFASGRYRCFASHEGRELTLFTLGCGDAVPLGADSAIEVCSDGEAAVIPRALFQRLVRSYPEFGSCVMSVIEGLLSRSLSMVGDMAFRSVRYRVIRHICMLAETGGRETANGAVIDSAPIGDELAMAIGAARQSVSTVLAELIRSGDIFRPTPRTLVISDIGRLQAELARSP
jgi:CRP-like cAMP-binding protein